VPFLTTAVPFFATAVPCFTTEFLVFAAMVVVDGLRGLKCSIVESVL